MVEVRSVVVSVVTNTLSVFCPFSPDSVSRLHQLDEEEAFHPADALKETARELPAVISRGFPSVQL